MAFSWSAPKLTEEEEAREFESLSLEERKAVYRDIYGREEASSTDLKRNWTCSSSSFSTSSMSTASGYSEGSESSSNTSLYGRDTFIADGDDERLHSFHHETGNAKANQNSCQPPTQSKWKQLEEIEKHIHNLPKSESEAYIHAKRVSPNLVATESDLSMFLHAERGDTKAAASRLAQYWSVRRRVFGIESWLCPMISYSGECVLKTDADVEYLNLVESMIERHTDAYGRTVLSVQLGDFSSDKKVNRSCVARALFYVMHIISMSVLRLEQVEQKQGKLTNNKSENSQVDCLHRGVNRGYVIILSLKDFDFYKCFNRQLVKKCVELCSVMPLQLNALHICFPSTYRKSYDYFMPPVKHLVGRMIRLRMVVHFGSSGAEFVHKLKQYGITRKHLPSSLGGTSKAGAFSDWIEEQENALFLSQTTSMSSISVGDLYSESDQSETSSSGRDASELTTAQESARAA